MTNRHRKIPRSLLSIPLALAGIALALPAAADTSYSYPRVVEGPATLLTLDGEREEVALNQPVLVGDRLWVPHGSRLELVLADRTRLRIEGDSEVAFKSIAYSAETEDTYTSLELLRGEFQMVVPEEVLGSSLPELRTAYSNIYVHREGTFRISVGDDYARLIVREGLAEMVTDEGSCLVHRGEAGFLDGGGRLDLSVRKASYRDGLERWGDRLSDEIRTASHSYVDDSLRYAAVPLERHGVWLEVGGRRAWRPRIEVSWRPYSRGYWRTTPIGFTWVSNDPWGYLTHHYGSWSHAAGYGWVWYPGRVYAPARVHWYWGPSYVGWCPSGYYGDYYRRSHSGLSLRYGHYGYAGGSWGHFNHWSFSVSLEIGKRRHRGHHVYSHHELERRNVRLERGIITNSPGVHHRRRGDEIYRELSHEVRNYRDRTGRDLADVTSFVARKPLREDLAASVLERRRTAADKPARARISDRRSADDRVSRATPSSRTRVSRSRTSADKPAISREDLRRPTRGDVSRPSSRPSRSETTRPSSRPSRGDVSRPSSRPSRTETIRTETTRPSRGDVSRPSSRPSRTETIRTETTRPSRGDVSRPSSRPSRGDLSRPSSRPGRTETTRPSSRPSRSETTRPSSRPSTRPIRTETTRPSSRPSRGDVSRPSSRPGRTETTRPSSRPSRGDVSRPSSRPGRTETSRPSSRPSRSETTRPSSRPSTRPSARPSRNETTRPSSRPSARPSRNETTRPSSRPSNRPSARPTGRASGRSETTRPSRNPSKPSANRGSGSRGDSKASRPSAKKQERKRDDGR